MKLENNLKIHLPKPDIEIAPPATETIKEAIQLGKSESPIRRRLSNLKMAREIRDAAE